MKVALAQINAEQGNVNKNMDKIRSLAERAKREGADMIVFPELAYTGYLLSEEEFWKTAETSSGYFAEEIGRLSKSLGIYISAGYAEKDGGNLYNSALLTDREGNLIINYRKRCLWKKEKRIFTPGDTFETADTEFGRVGILICYDMEFPEPSRALAEKGAEIVIAPSCFSRRAEKRWDLLVNANALFNLSYAVGVNICDRYCCGKSKAVAPTGENIIELSSQGEDFALCSIDISERREIMNEIPYLEDMKTFRKNCL